MTDWENQETESKYYDSLTFKLFCFQFVNSYASLFYIAFIKGDDCNDHDCMGELELQLATIWITNLFLNAMEIGLPLILNKRAMSKKIKEASESGKNLTEEEKENIKSKYETTLDDYMEMIIGYGYVVLFGVAFPFVSLISLFLAMIEVRVDAWKLCNLTTRPYPHQDNSIGIWITIIQVVSYAGAAVNIGIVFFTAKSFSISDTSTKWILFIAIEHSIFIFKFILSGLIPDKPTIVAKGLDWSERVVDEKLYNKVSDIDQERSERNLRFEPVKSKYEVKLEEIIKKTS